MEKHINKNSYLIFLFLLFAQTNIFGQNNNNSYIFNGEISQLYIFDEQPITTEANQNGFGYFNNNSSNNQITVQAWIYLIGDTPTDVEVPIVYRAVDGGNTFSIYLKNNEAYFSVGNNNNVTLNTNYLPAFQWHVITGTYDGATAKLFSGGIFVTSTTFSIVPGYTTTNGTSGLFIGRSESGAFRGLIDEVRIFDIALDENNINNSGGNGNPAENFPSSLNPYLRGQWKFTEFSFYNNTKSLTDQSDYYNHLRVENIEQIANSKHPPFIVINSIGDAPDLLPGDGVADAGNGEVTLRAAIQEANSLTDNQIIYFYISGIPPYIILPGNELPSIVEGLYLDGTVQAGYNDSPVIQINGTYGSLTVTGNNSTIRGLSINKSEGYSLTLSNLGSNTICESDIAGIFVSSPNNNIYNNTFSNSNVGVDISDGAGNTNLSDNTISGNNTGVALNLSDFILTTENTISGNTNYGIVINGSGNKIKNQKVFNNGAPGIFVQSGNNNSLLNNSVYSNNSLGIELGTGTNNSQEYPTLNTLYTWQDETALPDIKGGTSIQGTLNSSAHENYKIQFFANSNAVNREGKNYLGEIEVTTDLAGSADFLANLKDIVLPEGEVVSATATKLDNTGNTLSTSEFSESINRETDEGLHY
ncbi:MAG TPA: LamG-like jellyroll fold domain-containing protein, partial [Gillisia sp.]|nr:LamG-like jellyroll fold domain-containing protein [Gillisia sp.]